MSGRGALIAIPCSNLTTALLASPQTFRPAGTESGR